MLHHGVGLFGHKPYCGKSLRRFLLLATTVVTSSLGVGSHSIRAVYGGDAIHTGSTSNAVGESIQRASTSEMLSTTGPFAPFGQSVTFTAVIYPSSQSVAPTGTVAFYDNGGILLGTATVTLVGTKYEAVFTISTLAALATALRKVCQP